MIVTIIITVSVFALAMLGFFYWRAVISGIARQPISDQIRVAAGVMSEGIGARDFRSIIILKDLSPDLCGRSECFKGICAYYAIIETLGKIVPALSAWADDEMTTCSRYAAVLMHEHLQRNMIYATQVRGM
jgi:hypothetical protein